MNDKVTEVEYRFAGYAINRLQQVLINKNKNIKINTKAYYLLLTFLENHGKILSKDDLINSVWTGQIVTDAALTKQIVRLREVIGDTDPNNPMIETHRGVGYRFITPVEIHQIAKDGPIIRINNEVKTPEAHKHSKIQWLFLVAVLVIFASYYLFNQSIQSTENKPETKFLQAGIGLAIIPSKNNQDWLNKAGLNHLSEMLDRNQSIYTIKPQSDWYTRDEPEQLGIEITSNEKIEYAFLVNIYQSNNQLYANVKLRTADKLIASDELSSPNISELLVKLNNWVGKMLLADKKINEFHADNQISYDNYAMESYLMGVFHQEFNEDQKANQFYQAAVNKDHDFVQAWVQLADTNQRMGKNDLAVSIAESTLSKFEDKLSTKQLIKLNYIVAYAYFYKGDNDKAQSFLSQSISYINETANPLTQLTAYDSLGGLAFITQDWKKAEEYTLKRIEIAKDYYPFPNYMAAMSLILAEIYGSQTKLEKAKSHLYSAMDYYEKTNNSEGVIRVTVSMLTINLLQAEYDEGILLINKTEVYLNKITNPIYAFMFMSKATLILNLRGYFDQSNRYLNSMSQTSSENLSPNNQDTVAILYIHKYYVQDMFNETKIYLSSLNKIPSNGEQLNPNNLQYYLLDLLISARTESAETAMNKYRDYLQKFPNLKDSDTEAMIERSLGHIYTNMGNIQAGVEHFKAAEAHNRNKKDWGVANYIGFELLEVMLKHPEIDYKPTLTYISSFTKYDYMLFKLKAQFLAREGNYFEAAIIMRENKQKANQLWKPSDQLLLEEFQLKAKN